MLTRIFVVTAILIFLFTCGHAQQIIINELVSLNDSFFDNDGDSPDWIELFNRTDSVLNLDGYCLSDDSSNYSKWSFPVVSIQPKEYVLVFASGKDRSQVNQEYHANFSIKSEGETIFLSKNGSVIQVVPATQLKENTSLVYENGFLVSQTVTPGYKNEILQHSELSFSHSGGFYDDFFSLKLLSNDGEGAIRFTTDGSLPTIESRAYSGELRLTSELVSEIDLSAKLISPPYLQYIPSEKLPKAIVIRAAQFNEEGKRKSDVITHTYFIKRQGFDHQLPILALSFPQEGFFDDLKGILVPGIFFDSQNEDWSGNYYNSGRSWEREVHVELIDTSGQTVMNQRAGLRVHGGNARRFPQKGLRLYARSEYGKDEFVHDLFTDKKIKRFKRMVLGPASSSWSDAGIEDYMCNKIAAELNVDRVATKPVILYLNGEYWGLYYLEERIDEYYLESNHQIDKDSVDIITSATGKLFEGSDEEFLNFYKFVEESNFNEIENYTKFLDLVDINNFVDYHVLQIYLANSDWPSNNYKLWKNQKNGKWRWVFFDGDAGLKWLEHKTLFLAKGENNADESNNEKSTMVFRKLMSSEFFRPVFFKRFEELLNTSLHLEEILPIYNFALTFSVPELTMMNARFNYPESIGEWEEGVTKIQNFIYQRPCVIKEHVNEEYNVLLDVPDCNCDLGKLKEIEIYPNPSHGIFTLLLDVETFKKVNVRLMNSSGQLVREQDLFAFSGGNSFEIDYHQVDSGVYLLLIQTKEDLKAKRVILINN